MRTMTDQDHDPIRAPSTEAQGPESPRYTPSEMEDSFEEIER